MKKTSVCLNSKHFFIVFDITAFFTAQSLKPDSYILCCVSTSVSESNVVKPRKIMQHSSNSNSNLFINKSGQQFYLVNLLKTQTNGLLFSVFFKHLSAVLSFFNLFSRVLAKSKLCRNFFEIYPSIIVNIISKYNFVF